MVGSWRLIHAWRAKLEEFHFAPTIVGFAIPIYTQTRVPSVAAAALGSSLRSAIVNRMVSHIALPEPFAWPV